ncbi:MAG: 7,8-dihydro-8-oxoguanine triphosphatase [Candidatus Jorgensenbacteria bacterium GW2011_GWA1_48_11]|uniref:Oxidized purine nucleoside triphosphate hydrolase n=1 Tax=Candidatus Jorgensenbacteria bacterium GW2011_GWA1_48_11 TaxID=1618660 RepID=A0A0G1UAE8_9BACT|nr:MAG: 7,8-dihydro-8-oxoguanine triphosphatase [Candidatus Jorgensenbacteria bacterium GW2011_GWA1_48_11]KKW11780.1 MAG: 7,8-dihydro-8-oxoguanine triphosphatase [Candidatus Jorgensenbacteria bacterium GW2011_GWB1_49_9]
MKKILTLTLIHQPPRILLGMKKRGFGAGRWNGFGGKLNPGEDIVAAAKREIKEEVGLEILGDLKKAGIIDFSWAGKPDVLQVHVFRAEKFSGEPVESEEMKPQWFNVDRIPFDKMWSDDIHWLPLFLAGKTFRGRFVFDESDNTLEHALKETDLLE